MAEKIVACIDGSIYTKSVCEHAAWAAAMTGARIELLHVLGRRQLSSIPTDFSGSLSANDQEALLKELTQFDEQNARLAQERGRMLLDAAKREIEAAGAPAVTTRLRNGDLVEAITDLKDETRMVVIGKRGEAADFARLHLGSNLERVVRASRRPVLVAARAFKPIARVLIAYDGGASAERAVERLAANPKLAGLSCRLLMVGSGDETQKRRLDSAAAKLRAAGFKVDPEIRPGHPDEVIAERVEAENIDLLVMGAYGHSRIRSLIIGSTTTAMVRACLVPVFMVH